MNERGTLKEKEPHPAIESARKYLLSLGFEKLNTYLFSFSNCAIEGNRLAEVCYSTLDRLINKKPVSDRYFLGLCWTIRDLEEENEVQ